MPLWPSPVAVCLLLNEEGGMRKDKGTPVGKVRFLIYEISELDKTICRVQEKVKISTNPRIK